MEEFTFGISKNDKRKYELFSLENGLKVMLCSDETSNNSAVSLNINIGSSSDPDDILGLAHFVEHMLFMGSKKYPEENYYDTFISNNGGSANAFTTLKHTCFYYNILSDNFEKSLDIFSQFFIDPLFSIDSIDREMHAVDSEFWNSYNSDDRRLDAVTRKLMNPSHYASRFSCGNLKTLKRNDIYERLIEFYNKNYSSNLMTLAIVDKRPLNELKNMVELYFSPIKNKKTNKVISNVLLCNDNYRGSYVQVSLSGSKHILNILWQMPPTIQDIHIHPSEFFSHLIGHEGANSLLSELKRRKLVSLLHATSGSSLSNDYSTFQVIMTLTNKGNNNIEEILSLLYLYLDMLKNELIDNGDSFIKQKQIYEECKQISEISFNNKSKENPINYVIELATRLHYFKNRYVLCGDYYYEPFDSTITEKYKLYFDELYSKKPIIIHIPSSGTITNFEKWETEEIYNVKYKINDNFVIDKCQDKNVSLNLPDANIYIPNSIEVLKTENFDKPKLICSDLYSELWLYTDSKFNVPKTFIDFNILIPDIITNKKLQVISKIYCLMLNEYMNEVLYNAELVNYNCFVHASTCEISFRVNGYSDKLLDLWKTINEKFLTYPLDIDLYNFILERHTSTYANYVTMKLSDQSSQHIDSYFNKYYISHQERLDMLSNIDFNDILEFRNYLLNTDNISKYIGYVHGNISESDALNFKKVYDTTIKRKNFDSSIELSNKSIRDLIPMIFYETIDYKDVKFSPYDKKQIGVNNFVGVYYNLGISNTQFSLNNVYMSLFSTFISEPFFDSLRTKQQLGYSVSARRLSTKFFKQYINIFAFTVISSGKDTTLVKSKIKEFIDNIKVIINDENKFNELLESYYIELNEPFMTMEKEYNYYIRQIEMYEEGYNLNKYQDYISLIDNKKVTFDGFKQFVENMILNNHQNFTLIIE